MEELKILNDLKKYINVKSVGGEFEHGWNNSLKETKLQAIKWIKECRTNPRTCQDFEEEYDFYDAESVVVWIKYFFNITEGDLRSTESTDKENGK